MNSSRQEVGRPSALSLVHIAKLAKAGARKSRAGGEEAFSFALRNFLDGFYAARKLERRALLSEEPGSLRAALADGGVADAYLAALANYLSDSCRIARPAWSAVASERYPDSPWFALSSPNARIWLLTQSPAAFRERNLFISRDALTRA